MIVKPYTDAHDKVDLGMILLETLKYCLPKESDADDLPWLFMKNDRTEKERMRWLTWPMGDSVAYKKGGDAFAKDVEGAAMPGNDNSEVDEDMHDAPTATGAEASAADTEEAADVDSPPTLGLTVVKSSQATAKGKAKAKAKPAAKSNTKGKAKGKAKANPRAKLNDGQKETFQSYIELGAGKTRPVGFIDDIILAIRFALRAATRSATPSATSLETFEKVKKKLIALVVQFLWEEEATINGKAYKQWSALRAAVQQRGHQAFLRGHYECPLRGR